MKKERKKRKEERGEKGKKRKGKRGERRKEDKKDKDKNPGIKTEEDEIVSCVASFFFSELHFSFIVHFTFRSQRNLSIQGVNLLPKYAGKRKEA